MYNNYDDRPLDLIAMQEIDKFVSSETYNVICREADQGCEDSIKVLEQVSDMMGSLCFHLENKSGKERLDYELTQIKQFVGNWGDFD